MGTGPWLIEDFKPELIEDILNRLIPKNVYIMVVAKQFENIAKEEEKWYGTKYCSEKIPQEKLDVWSNAPLHDKLYVPPRNEFIPSDFSIAPRDEDHKLGQFV